MDYEKAYNEAIKRAKAIIEVAEKEEEVYKSAITIFPELRESEDEQIRKEIEQLIQCMHDADPRKERWIAWLEKQKEYESTDFEYVWDRTDCGDLTSALDKYSEEAIINMCHAWYDKGIELERKSWLEKQGEQKTSVVDFKAKDWYVSKVDGKIYNAKFMEKTPTNQARKLEIEKAAMSATGIIKQEEWFIKGAEWSDKNPSYICSEKQNEQKPVDNIEPKFKVGDWIVWQNKCYKVNYNGCGYELIDQNGLSTSLEYGTVDKSAHLWTIQDAKDGDVLVFKNNIGGIIICKSPSDYDTRSYCRLIRDNLINKEESGWDSTLLVPATKEQRDLLFQKMKEAGCMFDFGKKELKKIERKPQRMVSAEAKEALYDKPTDEEMKELLRTEYEKGRADTIAEMERDWSEEDEVKINRIVACLENLNVADNDILLKDVDWLKSLKDRVIPKPKHEWSIEDERTIAIINNALTESNTPPDDYDKVYDWLESIKQRIGWKPSNAQIEALEHFVKSIGEGGYASPYDNNTKLLYSLLEQLKKLKA